METLMESPKEQLMARLEEPEVVETLNRLLDQLPLLTFGVEALSGFVKRGDVITENIARQVVEIRQMEFMQKAPEWTDSLPGLMKTGAQLADTASKPAFNNLLNQGLIEELGKPETIDLVKRLLDKLELIVFAVEATDGLLRRGDSMIENVRDSLRDAAKLAPSPETIEQMKSMAASAPMLIEKATEALDSGLIDKVGRLADVGDKLSQSKLLEPETIHMISDLGEVLGETLEEARQDRRAGRQPKRIGIFGLLGALKDPNIQASLALLLSFSRRYGQKVRAAQSA